MWPHQLSAADGNVPALPLNYCSRIHAQWFGNVRPRMVNATSVSFRWNMHLRTLHARADTEAELTNALHLKTKIPRRRTVQMERFVNSHSNEHSIVTTCTGKNAAQIRAAQLANPTMSGIRMKQGTWCACQMCFVPTIMLIQHSTHRKGCWMESPSLWPHTTVLR